MNSLIVVVLKSRCKGVDGVLVGFKVHWPYVLFFERLVKRLDMSVLFWSIFPDKRVLAYPQGLDCLSKIVACVLVAVVCLQPQF